MRYVFLDTEVFRQHQLDFFSSAFLALRHLGEIGVVRLLMPDIVEHEILEDLRDNAEKYTKIFKEHSDHFRRIGAAGEFDVLSADDYHDLHLKAFRAFQQSLTVEKVGCHNFAPAVLEAYFKGTPPFGDKKKRKQEFPDAFAFEAIKAKALALSAEEKLLAVTFDGAFTEACKSCSKIEHYSKLPDLLGALNRLDGTLESIVRRAIEKFIRDEEDGILAEFPMLNFELAAADSADSSISAVPDDMVIKGVQILEKKGRDIKANVTIEVGYYCTLEYRDPEWLVDYYARETYQESSNRTALLELSVSGTLSPDNTEFEETNWDFITTTVKVRPRQRRPR